MIYFTILYCFMVCTTVVCVAILYHVGMHDNAEITSAINSTNEMLDTALQLQPRAAGGAGKS